MRQCHVMKDCQCELVPQGVSSPLAMSTGSEKLLENSLAVLKKEVLEIFTKPKLRVCAVIDRTIKQNRTNPNT